MNNTITLIAPLRKYDGAIINLNAIAYVKPLNPAGCCLVAMMDGEKFRISNSAAQRWFGNFYDDCEKTPPCMQPGERGIDGPSGESGVGVLSPLGRKWMGID